MSEYIPKEELKRVVEAIFAHMDEVSATAHPWVVEDFYDLARLADLPLESVPTELRSLSRESTVVKPSKGS